MSLNHKRRIFRPSFSAASLLPGRRVLLVAAGGIAALVGGTWLSGGPSPAPAQGPALVRLAADASRVMVMDGATLRLDDRVVRLAGLTEPARGETCRDATGRDVDCGVAAANALAMLVREGRVDCELRPQGRDGQPAAVCAVRGRELNRAQVLAGWARGDGALADAQVQAQAAHRGMWASATR